MTVAAVDEADPARLREWLKDLYGQGSLEFVYERYSLDGLVASRFCREYGIPHVLEVNAPLEQEARKYRGLRLGEGPSGDDTEMFQRAALVIAVSQGCVDFCQERGVPVDRIYLAPNGVDLDLFRPPAAASAPLPGIPAGRPVVGFHGRLRPWHGFKNLCRVFAGLLQDGRDLHLVTLGEGDFEADAAGLVPDDRWMHLPWVDHEQVGPILGSFDLLPLTYEQSAEFYFSPLKLLEAMACGVVPVVPELGDLPAMVGHGSAGRVYAAGDWSGLRDACSNLLDSQPERERLSRAAIALAGENSWTHIAEQVRVRLERSQGGC